MVEPPPEKLTPELIYREYAPRIYNIARRILGNDADAEDVMQEVLLLVIRKLDTFRGDSQLGTWLHRVTVNAALGQRQKQSNRLKHEAGEVVDDLTQVSSAAPVNRWSVSPDEPVLAAEQQELIEKAIKTLPEPFRDVFVLADVEGLPSSEIADMLKLSVSAVKSRLHRARLWMRESLAPHFEGGMAS